MARGRGGGAATRRTGAAINPRGSATRGFTPAGAQKGGGKAWRSGKEKWKPVGNSGYGVTK
jgi:hypothetical protein